MIVAGNFDGYSHDVCDYLHCCNFSVLVLFHLTISDTLLRACQVTRQVKAEMNWIRCHAPGEVFFHIRKSVQSRPMQQQEEEEEEEEEVEVLGNRTGRSTYEQNRQDYPGLQI